MFGILLVVIAALFVEIGCSIAKHEHSKHSEDIWGLIFINSLVALAIYIGVGIYRGTLDFVVQSWPILTMAVLLNLTSNFVGNMTTLKSSRSMAGVFKMLTVPLLTITDYLLGYDISPVQILGIGLVVLTIIGLIKRDAWHKSSTKWLMLNTIMNVFTITIYKYSIDHIATVETFQVINLVLLIIGSILAARIFTQQNLFKLLTHPFALLQAGSMGLGSALDGFAYSYAPASIINAAYRSAQSFWTLVSGSFYFHEHKIFTRVVAVIFLIGGVFLLVR